MKALERIQRVQRERNQLQKLRNELTARRARKSSVADDGASSFADLSLMQLIPALKPEFQAPFHLSPLVQELERAILPHKGQRLFFFSVPPRHWKTVTLTNSVIKHLLKWPGERVAYCTHTQPFANAQSRAMRKLALKAGLKLSTGANRQDEWEIEGADSGLIARGGGGDITGRGCRLLILDDLIKNREEANSPATRQKIWDSINDDFLTRLTPDGTAILVHTRWHEDDPIGRAKDVDQWEGLNIPALGGDDESRPLLEEYWDYEALDRIRKRNPWSFSALYQGRPRPKGDNVFNEPAKFTWSPAWRPPDGYHVGYGVDLAYTKKQLSKADFSVCVRMYRVDAPDLDPEKAIYYIQNVSRAQVKAPQFSLALKNLQDSEPGPMRWHASGTELGAADFIIERVDNFHVQNASADKHVRAMPLAAAWNENRVFVPGGEDRPAWVDDFVDEMTNFTGVADKHDDQVDAASSAFDVLCEDAGQSGAIIIPGRRR